MFAVWLVVACNPPKSPDMWLWLSSLCKLLSSLEHFYNCIIISPWSLAPGSLSSRFNLRSNNQDIMASSNFEAIKASEARSSVYLTQPLETGRNCELLKVIRGKELLSSVCVQTSAQTGHTGGQRVILRCGCLSFMNLCPQIPPTLAPCRTESRSLGSGSDTGDWFCKVLCVHSGMQA